VSNSEALTSRWRERARGKNSYAPPSDTSVLSVFISVPCGIFLLQNDVKICSLTAAKRCGKTRHGRKEVRAIVSTLPWLLVYVSFALWCFVSCFCPLAVTPHLLPALAALPAACQRGTLASEMDRPGRSLHPLRPEIKPGPTRRSRPDSPVPVSGSTSVVGIAYIFCSQVWR